MPSPNLSRPISSRNVTTLPLRRLAAAGLIAVIAGTPALANPPATMTLAQAEKRHHELLTEAKRILLAQGDWNQAKKLLDEACSLTVKTPGGQSPFRSSETKEADFYWAWILCQSPAERDQGRLLLDKTLQVDLWPADKQARIKKVREQCGAASNEQPPVVAQKVEEKFVLAAIQKGGNWSQPVRLQPRAALSVLPWDQRDITKAAIYKLFPSCNVVEAQPFIVAGPFSASYLSKLSDTVLAPYYHYLTKSLGIEYDWETIFVFVTPDHTKFADMANALYQVDPADRIPIEISIAFSDLPNQTMMAICGKDASNCTSFAHELFHLLNSKAFEDAPWWLYEGMAELFESGDLRNGVFHARAGWRKDKAAIDRLDTKSFDAMLRFSKNDPALYTPPGAGVAMSRVRFFCRYLHEKGALLRIYDELHKRDWRATADDPAGIGVIMKTLNKNSLDEVHADFRQWFTQVVLPEPGATGP